METKASKYYKSNIESYSKEFDELKRKGNRLTLYRLLCFIIGSVGLYFAATMNVTAVLIELVLFIGVFIQLVRFHIKNQKKKDKVNALLSLNENELKALKGDYSNFETGEEFKDQNHRYSDDLDIFGIGSLFQLLNRTITLTGKQTLSNWLSKGLMNEEDIIKRQKAVNELSPNTSFRQDFLTTLSKTSENDSDKSELQSWMEEKPLLSGKSWNIILILIPVITTILLFLCIFSMLSINLFILYLFAIPLGITGAKLKQVNIIHNKLGKKSDILLKYSKLLKLIEKENFSSTLLKDKQCNISDDTKKPSQTIEELSGILSKLDYRLNMITAILLNAFFLWDLNMVKRMEKWKDQNSLNLNQWFKNIGYFDALLSLANYSYNNEEYIYPEVSADTFQISGHSLAHPMIDKNSCVSNPIHIATDSNFIVITGANMAGKSTYLRTVGVTLILAMAGAPVAADSFKFSPVSIFSSIRTKDSLQKHESYFYAELRRLKEIIDTLKTGEHLFILLDEILKGTNSKDKQNGSIALLKQLIHLKASGIIATHDLNLGNLVDEYPDNVTNKCFEVEIIEDHLSFDYLLKDGVSQNLNATFLMKKMGIGIM